MFEAAFENLRKATDSAFRARQEAFNRWVGLWPVVPPFPAGLGVVQKYQKKWAEVVGELATKQLASTEAQFSEGLRAVEELFRLAEVEDPEELRTRVVDLWQNTYDSLRQKYEARVGNFLAAVAKGAELIMQPAAAFGAPAGPDREAPEAPSGKRQAAVV
jgi:hypothetical protein